MTISARTATVLRSVAWALVFIAPAAAVATWFTPHPDLDRDDAIETAVGSLAEAGLEAEPVLADVERSVHEAAKGRKIGVWVVPVEVDGEQIELRVQRGTARLAYVDDLIGPDDTERLLTDDEYDVLKEYRNDAVEGRWARRNGGAAVAAMAIVGVAYVLAKRSAALWRAP